jgi:hypothetical protein
MVLDEFIIVRKMDSVAQGVKDNRRLASFTMEDANEFYARLKGLYNSELEQWLKRCPHDSWKYSLICQEVEIRSLKRTVQELEAELW